MKTTAVMILLVVAFSAVVLAEEVSMRSHVMDLMVARDDCAGWMESCSEKPCCEGRKCFSNWYCKLVIG